MPGLADYFSVPESLQRLPDPSGQAAAVKDAGRRWLEWRLGQLMRPLEEQAQDVALAAPTRAGSAWLAKMEPTLPMGALGPGALFITPKGQVWQRGRSGEGTPQTHPDAARRFSGEARYPDVEDLLQQTGLARVGYAGDNISVQLGHPPTDAQVRLMVKEARQRQGALILDVAGAGESRGLKVRRFDRPTVDEVSAWIRESMGTP